jgi:hypothetical protein
LITIVALASLDIEVVLNILASCLVLTLYCGVGFENLGTQLFKGDGQGANRADWRAKRLGDED